MKFHLKYSKKILNMQVPLNENFKNIAFDYFFNLFLYTA